ncbi:ArsR/SmtB family transcription factor [Metabacillus sp. RGM 3146]|uniref:ArsR/SmtB family transcription factor n=1 Tax=Metabacillus sp. RGM 3146 TaxID=3401092 RepID=UPI003B9CBF4C
MNANPNTSMIAALVSEESRSRMLTAMLDGRFHTAGELAMAAGIKPQTASFHLAKMAEAHTVIVEKQGRHRYYGLRNQEVAEIMELLLTAAPPAKIQSFKQVTEDKAMRYARTCYDHLAGNLGVAVTEFLLNGGYVKEKGKEFSVTEKGEAFFEAFEIDLVSAKKKRRSFCTRCLDWSERRHHLAGALGNALLERFFELHWLERMPNTRSVKVTPLGKKGLREVFSIENSAT